MEDEDFIELEAELRELCISIGAPELTEDRFYRARDGLEGQEHLLPPRKRLVAQLDALGRFMSLYDGSVYEGVIRKIQYVLQEEAELAGRRLELPSHAFVTFPDRPASTEEAFDLRSLPDLSDLRRQLAELRDQLSET